MSIIKEVNQKYKEAIDKNYTLYKSNKLFALLYPITLIICIVVFIIGAVKTLKNKFEMKFIPVLIMVMITGIGGYVWTIYIQNITNFPPWFYFPWNYTGIEPFSGLCLLDLIFFPASTLMTCVVYYAWKKMEKERIQLQDFKTKIPFYLFFGFFYLSTLFVTFLTRQFGLFDSLFFSWPAIFMMVVFHNKINTKGMITFVLTMTTIGFLWNFLLVDFIPLIGKLFKINLDSFSAWSYVLKILNNFILHSPVYMDKTEYPYMWICNSPVIMVVDMPFKASTFCYLMLEFLNEFNWKTKNNNR